MPALYAIGDTHVGYRNIIAYTGRPFPTVEAMDAALTEAWNAVVQDQDWVFHLGDFGLAPKAMLKELASRLRGRKILVMGNHDRCTPSWWRRAGFVQAYRHPLVFRGWIFSHRPLSVVPVGYRNVHGHLHNRPALPHAWLCVSVEQTGYVPVRLADDLPDGFGVEHLRPWGTGGEWASTAASRPTRLRRFGGLLLSGPGLACPLPQARRKLPAHRAGQPGAGPQANCHPSHAGMGRGGWPSMGWRPGRRSIG